MACYFNEKGNNHLFTNISSHLLGATDHVGVNIVLSLCHSSEWSRLQLALYLGLVSSVVPY
jgi:hypothetical protein